MGEMLPKQLALPDTPGALHRKKKVLGFSPVPVASQTCSVTMDKSRIFFRPCFPHLQCGDLSPISQSDVRIGQLPERKASQPGTPFRND